MTSIISGWVGVDVGVGIAVSVGRGVAVEVAVAVGGWVSVGAGVADWTGRSVGINDGTAATAACKGGDSASWLISPAPSLQAFRMSRLNNRRSHGPSRTLLLKRVLTFSNRFFPKRHHGPGLFRQTLPNIQENPPDENPAGLDQVITPGRDLL